MVRHPLPQGVRPCVGMIATTVPMASHTKTLTRCVVVLLVVLLGCPSVCHSQTTEEEEGVSTVTLVCPTTIATTTTPISTTTTQSTLIAIAKTSGIGALCTLSLQIYDDTNKNFGIIPISRSYNGNDWERAGGTYVATYLRDEWDCSSTSTSTCSILLPPLSVSSSILTSASNTSYILQTRSIPSSSNSSNPSNNNPPAEVARFLEAASFGPTPTDLSSWVSSGTNTDVLSTSFAQYIYDQSRTVPATLHRQYFRRTANPRWTFHKPEFAARLDPCTAQTTWRRQILTTNDLRKQLVFRRVNERWEITIDQHVRSIVRQIRLVEDNKVVAMEDGQSYLFCSDENEIRRGIFKLRIQSICRTVVSNDLMIDFPIDYIPSIMVEGRIPALGTEGTTTLWKKTSSFHPEYIYTEAISTWNVTTFKLPNESNEIFVPIQGLFSVPIACRVVDSGTAPPSTTFSVDTRPMFALTMDEIWVQFDPKIDKQMNTIEEPLLDGGLTLLQSNHIKYCINAPRTFFNEHQCIMTNVSACMSGWDDQLYTTVDNGAIVCGSHGEVSNDIELGDNWIDVSSINVHRAAELRVPVDTTSIASFSRQREFIWSKISIQAKDQLRQRIAFALMQIFSLPKMSISSEFLNTEAFVQYYDIFIRHAFGNYRDILTEISYNPLNAESLSYINSRSVAHVFKKNESVVYPDENYAREVMQLFTIGLKQLNMDGTPVLDSNGKTIQTYDSNDILSLAKIWTGFQRSVSRANVESVDARNRNDPLRISPTRRDRFPKSDLSNGYIGDTYPLCVDIPSRAFLRVGAKYRLLGSLSLPELRNETWTTSKNTQRLVLPPSSNLFKKLCAKGTSGSCSFPNVVVLENNLVCDGVECELDTIQVLKIENVYYEYIRIPCVELAFFNAGITTAMAESSNARSVCANPTLPIAAEACCASSSTGNLDAIPACKISAERMTYETAQNRCTSIGRELCQYRSMTATEKCPDVGTYWTNESCTMQLKIANDGQVAIVHPYEWTSYDVTVDTPSFFKAYWVDDLYPTVENNCGGGACQIYENTCICNIGVTAAPVFTALPENSASILQQLPIGNVNIAMYDSNTFIPTAYRDYRYFHTTASCCSDATFFEVTDTNGQIKLLRNVRSTVTISGTSYQFRNPPQFNSVLFTEYSVADAHYETEALFDHLLFHPNTPPFVSFHFTQRFGISNPTPRYVRSVADAFKSGKYQSHGIDFGTGTYGDLEATIAAVLLDREARSIVLDSDPIHGSLREPILKVLAFLRATEFEATVPSVELDFMDQKIGQMAYEQGSVFSFFRPDFVPSELSGTGLSVPESQVMSSTNVVGILNGIYSLIKNGLKECDDGFGAFGACDDTSSSGRIRYKPSNINEPNAMVRDLSNLLAGGRLNVLKQNAIVAEIAKQPNAMRSYEEALQLLVTLPEFHSTNSVDQLAPIEQQLDDVDPTIPPQTGYKAVIHLFFRGGCDSFNVLLPSTTCVPLFDEYKYARGDVGLKPSETLPLSGDTSASQPCAQFAIHGGLSTVQQLYDDSDLLFMANVGVLTEYVNRENYLFRTETPLFSHNSMQDEVSRLDPLNLVDGTGTLGRMADVLQAKGYMTSRTTVDSPSTNLVSQSAITPPILSLSQEGVSMFDTDMSSPTFYTTIEALNSGDSGIYGDFWSTIMKRSIGQSGELFTILKNTPASTTFPETNMGNRLKLIAQLIAARETRLVDRDFFFIPFDGFDSHNDVGLSLEKRFEELNDALEAFVTELKLLGVWDNVTIVQTSDFGRTMSGNSGGGTDHGWGGNYWLAGGGVSGRRIVGKYPPTFSLDYEYNIDRGRLIPTTSWDSVFNAISDWMGVTAEDELNSILPNRQQFSDLFKATDLFL